MKHRTSLTTAAATLLALGCTSGMLGSGDQKGSPVGGSAGTGTVESGASGGAAASASGSGSVDPSAPAGANLRLLTNAQYRATLRTLFPFADDLPYVLEEDLALSGLRSIGAANIALSPKATEAYQKVAEQAATRAFSSVPVGTAFAGCNVAELGCASSFISDFGRRAFRRSLAADEQARFQAIYQAGVQKLGDGAAGLKYALMAILGSPHFLYRVELGVPNQGGPTPRRLTDVEAASKLAYFLSNGPPDAPLLALAESGGLRTAGALSEQAARLLSGPALAKGVESLFDDYLSLGNLDSVEKLPAVFPTWTPSLLSAMRQETLLDLSKAATSAADFRSTFNTNKTFVNQELAKHYGVSGVTGAAFVEVELPAASGRRGLMGHGSMLSVYSHASLSSPTLRGKFVRQILLCQGVPAPPPDIDTTLPDTSEAATVRERLTLHRTNPSCAGCHRLMDPIGLGLENFDAIGAYRAAENGQAIDASGELDGRAFSGQAELADALAQHPKLPECLSRTIFRYAWGRLEGQADEALIAQLTSAFSGDQYRFTTLLKSAVDSPNFVNVGELD